MEQPEMKRTDPLCDVFATQGILIVFICIGVFTLHLTAPAFCADLLTEWHRIAADSTELTAIAETVRAWFVSIFAG